MSTWGMDVAILADKRRARTCAASLPRRPVQAGPICIRSSSSSAASPKSGLFSHQTITSSSSYHFPQSVFGANRAIKTMYPVTTWTIPRNVQGCRFHRNLGVLNEVSHVLLHLSAIAFCNPATNHPQKSPARLHVWRNHGSHLAQCSPYQQFGVSLPDTRAISAFVHAHWIHRVNSACGVVLSQETKRTSAIIVTIGC
jgi:hypothetical protein